MPMIGPDVREGLFGGRGKVQVWDMLGPRPAAPFRAVLACELDPGGSVGQHVQTEFPEIVISMEGEGVAEVDGTAHPLVPGELVFLPLGSVLAIRNASAEHPLRYLIIKAGGDSEPAPAA
jgi:quercetin dioxygenase-like cupin family protein